MYDIFVSAGLPARLVPICITAGQDSHFDKGTYFVPKKDLVGSMVAIFQQRRLHVADLPLREQLLRELQNFRVRITMAGNETFRAWRESVHDAPCLSVAMNLWWNERENKRGVTGVNMGVVSRAPVFANPNAASSTPAASRFGNPGTASR